MPDGEDAKTFVNNLVPDPKPSKSLLARFAELAKKISCCTE